MSTNILKTRILAALGSTALASGAIAAPGCDNGSDVAPNVPSDTGMPGMPRDMQCLSRDEVLTMCGMITGCAPPAAGYCCYTEAGSQDRWNPDGGTPCPDSIFSNPVGSYEGPPASRDGGACCYVFMPGMATASARPFVVEGELRVALVVARGDWAEELRPLSHATGARVRGALAAAWLEDARLEHASVASFARFVLELLSVGAPPNLIAEAQRATGDEIRHATLCFSLASRYAGTAVGAGPLDVARALSPSVTLAQVAASTVREGCVHETIGAVRARAALVDATDPDVVAVLSVIADDEARHAELAWGFVRWAIAEGGPVVRTAVEQAFSQTLAVVAASAERLHDGLGSSTSVEARALRAHGRLSREQERTLLDDTMREVIEPCARVLLGSARKTSGGARLFPSAD
jgi:hypothetical protein